MPFVIEYHRSFFNKFNIKDAGNSTRPDNLLFYGTANYQLFDTRENAKTEIEKMIKQIDAVKITEKNKRNLLLSRKKLEDSNIVERKVSSL